MGAVADFARTQIRAAQTTGNAPMPRPAQCQLVTKLAGHGVAAQAGVAPKDFLSVVDGQPAARVSSRLHGGVAAQRAYTFYSRERHELIELVATGIDIGVLIEPTTSAIRATYKPQENDVTAQEILWAGRDFEALEKLTAQTLATGKERESPALLFHGAALYETGRIDAGSAEIGEYLARYATKWTMNFAGIARYYAGLEARRRGQEQAARQIWAEAWVYNQSERMAALLEKATGTRPREPPSPWLQRRFPVDYAYPSFEVPAAETVALVETLGAMSNDQLLGVCLLANYRSNGPYAEFLLRWRNYATHMARFFAGLHVLTHETKRYPNREYHYKREADARAAGLPFHLLHETDDAVVSAVAPRGSPTILLLDRTGTIVYVGELDSVDVWDVLASVQG